MEEAINNDEAISDYFIVSNPDDGNINETTNENLDNNDQEKQQENPPPIPMEQEEPPSEATDTMNEEDGKENDSTESQVNEEPQIAVTKVLSATQIDEMFHLNEPKDGEEESIDKDEESYDLNPQVNIEDMKVALDELREVDVLVCGSCHNVVHFVEEFMKHKPVCKRKSDFHGNIAETKPQVWAFLLWKNAQAKINKRGTQIEESSWKLYQKWCKMPERIRNAWVAAGQTVMNFSTFGYAKPVDTVIKPLPAKKSIDKEDFEEAEEEKPVIMRKLVQRDSSGEIKEIKSAPGIKRRMEDIENIRNQLEDGDSSQDTKEVAMGPTDNEIPRVGYTKIHRVKGKDGEQDTLQEEEFVVEKIVSRRFNPRRKQYEYLLKWEGYPSEQNTWEPAENLEACQHLLKAFEENLAKQNKQKAVVSRKNDNNQTSNSGNFSYGGRPIRYSKQKALNQVKAWCGSIKPDDAELEMLKRRMPITDSDEDEDPFAKKLKLERETDSEDSLGGRVIYSKSGKSGIIRRPGRPPLKPKITNGTTESLAAVLGLESSGDESKSSAAIDAINRGIVKKSTGLSPHNQQVLVANAKGVVKVDPSQVPNLSSGVYIMSNKSGIIKLDSVSPSKALSLKGATPNSVKQLSVQSNAATNSTTASAISTNSGAVTTTTQSGVIMVNRENHGLAKSGVMRRPGVTRGRGVGRPPGRPPSSSYRVSNPNTRLIHSGSRSNIAITPAIRPKLPLRPGVTTTSSSDLQRSMDGERKVLGPKMGRGGIGGRGGIRGRGGGRGGYMSVNNDKKDLDTDNVFIDLPQESSSDSDAGLPDLFPTDLPPLEPESPPRPLTLCPETGKVLLKAEGEKTPEPTPPQSPKQNLRETTAPSMPAIKEEPLTSNGSSNSFLSKFHASSSGKETLVKKTLKPGTIGSMSVSPKKSFEENDPDIVTITGEDGLVYRVKKSELNDTLLVSGEDGPQCVYMATGEEGEENATVLTLDPSYADTVAQLGHVNILSGDGDGETQFYVKEGEEGELVSLQVQGGTGNSEGNGEEVQSQVVAQLVEAGEPAPGGGPRRVVLLLPDGNLMMTEVDEEQYAALELDKFQSGGDME